MIYFSVYCKLSLYLTNFLKKILPNICINFLPPFSILDSCTLTFEIPIASEVLNPKEIIIPSFSYLHHGQHKYKISLVGNTMDGATSNSDLTEIGYSDKLKRGTSSAAIVSKGGYFVIKDSLYSPKLIIRISLLNSNSDIKRINVDEFILFLIIIKSNISPGIQNFKCKKKLFVPAISQIQYEENKAIRKLCAPTCLSMVSRYHGIGNPEEKLFISSYNSAEKIYGFWPQMIYAANQLGLIGLIYIFSTIDEICHFISKKIPILATITFEDGRLKMAPCYKTPGHFVIITGIENRHIYVNDPAFPNDSQVSCSYLMDNFLEIWFSGKGSISGGVGLIFFNENV